MNNTTLIITRNPDIITIPVFRFVDTVLDACTMFAYICMVSTINRNEKTSAPICMTLLRVNILSISSIFFQDILDNVCCFFRLGNLDELRIDLRPRRLHEYISVIDDTRYKAT